MILSVVFLGCLLFWLLQRWNLRQKRLPPGPFVWPLVGNLPQILVEDAVYGYVAMTNIAKKFGNIILVQVGIVDIVVVSGYQDCKRILGDDRFLNRFDDDWFIHRSFGKRIGLLAAPTELWNPTRKFASNHLRAFGFGKKDSMESTSDEEFQKLAIIIDRIIDEKEGIVDPHTLFKIPVINTVWTSVSGNPFEHDDPKIQQIESYNSEFTVRAKIMEGIPAAYPFLVKWLPFLFSDYKKMYEVNISIQKFLQSLVNEIRSAGTYKTDPNCFIEMYLANAESPQAKDTIFATDEHLVAMLYDIFYAGSDTTTNTLTFALMWLTMKPEVQEKIRRELDVVIGSARSPKLAEKDSLPYTRATIMEIHRRSHIVPLSPRKVYEDTPYDDYIIPKNTTVLVNLYSSMMDSNFWEDPENFRPERFLDSQNQIITSKAERVINFSTGKRNCVGEQIAEATIFVFLTQLIQNFEFLPAFEGQVFDTAPAPSAVLSPKLCNIRIKRRN